jgi:hypothetical protein
MSASLLVTVQLLTSGFSDYYMLRMGLIPKILLNEFLVPNKTQRVWRLGRRRVRLHCLFARAHQRGNGHATTDWRTGTRYAHYAEPIEGRDTGNQTETSAENMIFVVDVHELNL